MSKIDIIKSEYSYDHHCRNYLAQAYKFNCSCQVCSLPPEESHASDLRLQSMSLLYNKFRTWMKNEIDGLEALDLVRRIWHAGEEEGYWSEYVNQDSVCFVFIEETRLSVDEGSLRRTLHMLPQLTPS